MMKSLTLRRCLERSRYCRAWTHNRLRQGHESHSEMSAAISARTIDLAAIRVATRSRSAGAAAAVLSVEPQNMQCFAAPAERACS